ncbi:LamG-like jellyroll fold domain-containing protein [Flavivirga algicola]|uniref:Choice-of-anchor D domain-containing protein n=1 Tax=Flavivirga algicola TaxID=2729136 RepID=A0ABX1RRM1_9FLAO|nr:LamG-like jellyroll fold domain-containing protein [Flavivirga algicola]NMH86205.1 choice-of-anchor D domain-containing protein [Flavivirga algicola]
MKNMTHRYALMVLIFSLYTSFNVTSQTIASYDFEGGLQSWTDGGSDSGLNTSSVYASNGTQSIYSKDNDTSQNYTTSPILNLSAHSSVDFSFSFIGRNIDTGEGFSLQYYNGTSWSTVKTYVLGTDFTSNNYIYTFYQTINSGLASNAQFRFSSTSSDNGEYSYFDDILIKVSAPEIDVHGNSLSISNGDVTPSNSDHTSFGTSNSGTQVTRTYTVYNKGGNNLTISNIALSNTADFSIIAPFYSSPVLPSTGSTTFTIQFTPSTLGTKTSTVTITNNDADEASYQFDIEARSEQNFFDSDGDGVLDNVDIDDDNDGIPDSEEESSCSASSISQTTNYKFLNETFGEGNRTTINTTYDAETTYCYEDGTFGSSITTCPNLGDNNLSDGEYVVYYKAGDGDGTNDTPNGEVASWADSYWYTGEDHTSGDTNGRMAMFNASYDPGTFYTATIIGSLPNIPITYSFWVLNLDTTDAPGIATRLRPDILVEFRDVNNNVLASITTGDIPPSINGDPAGSWHQFTANLTFNVSEFYVYFINNEVGGAGNDLAIDDIVISQTLCDTDGDGVADIFDLDSDNDGIPGVVEAGLGSYSDGKATLTNNSSWVDANNNGMHDLSEGNSTLDSDGDGTPNYLDLDSDNDTIFDVDESGATNSGSTTYQNGDGDITGDGVGDGTDTDAVRETDINSDGISEYFTDGILDVYDFFNGNTFVTGYGNSNQGSTGSGWENYVADTDNDNIPDYIDVTSDGSTYDISHTLYDSLDGNDDGIIDDTNDAEGDGILDLFDTDDAVFGSPRDLNRKLQLYFDGRNDYAAENTVIDGWQEAAIMSWIKIDPASSGDQIIIGQNNFQIQLNSDKSISASSNGSAISSSTPLPTNQWIHVAATYKCDCLSGNFKLYINGTAVNNAATSGGLNTDTSSFTIGRKPDTDSNYFHGYIDEVRVFDKALSENELHKMIHQEIENNAGIARGTIIPLDITDFVDTANVTPLNWSSLQRYYRLDTYKDDIIDDLTTASVDVGSGAKIYNTKIIDGQTAPLPYVTTSSCSGAWTDSSNWEQGNLWDISGTTPNCAIIQIKGDLRTNTDLTTVGLIIDSGSKLEIDGNSGLTNSWYLKLDGKIDLEGESQLVQTEDSTLDATSSGTLERDQQGTADTYTYNYWSSPVGLSNNSTNNNSYKLPDVFTNVNFLTSGYNGATSPIGIADYWIWKFSNQQSDDYSKWQHVRSTGTMLVGEGFTMKGPGTGSISTPQNYVLNGKPNNGDITLNISSGNDYLVGNPYPSAIDAVQFILDNGPTIAGSGSTTGTLYFWEHWGGGSHILREYQGGYATYSLSGGVPAASKGTNDPDVATGGTPTKTPGRYIPVAQGFFVTAENAGTIKFNNGQRVFQTEDGSSSLFVKSSNTKKNKAKASNKSNTGDTRMKLRIGFNSINEIHRQLLITVDENASVNYDWGYDSKYIDTQADDMYWLINNEKFTIQGIDHINDQTIIPLGLHTKKDGFNNITIDKLENTPENLEIYLHDKELGVYQNLKQSNYEIYLAAGEYLSRFEITFSGAQTTLGIDDIDASPIETHYSNEENHIIINNPTSKLIKSVEMLNILGQSLFKFQTNTNERHLTYNASQIKTGNYILKIQTSYGTISKKVLIK